MSMSYDSSEFLANPLDRVEEVLTTQNWVFNRMTHHELMVNVTGKDCEYRLFFLWQPEMNAMQFCCQYDLRIDPDNRPPAARALMTINEALWMGHFDIPQESGTPSFRHTSLFRGTASEGGTEPIEDLIDIAMAQCERYYPVFFVLSTLRNPDDQSLSLAMMDTLGRG